MLCASVVGNLCFVPASVVGNLCFVPVWWGTYALCQCGGEPMLCASVVGNLCFVPVWWGYSVWCEFKARSRGGEVCGFTHEMTTWYSSTFSARYALFYKCRKLLASVEFLLVSPSLIRDSESEQTWHMSSSMHYACSCVMGCMEAQQSEGCAVRSFLWSCWFVPVWWGTYMLCASVVGNLCLCQCGGEPMLCASVVGNLCFVPVRWGTYPLCQCGGELMLCASVVGNLPFVPVWWGTYMLCASVVGNLCFVPVWWGTYMLCASAVGNLYALCQCGEEPILCASVVRNLYMLCASVVGNLCFVPVW